MSAAQHIEWLNLVEKIGPFLAVGVLDEAFPQGLEKVETRKRQRVRSAYEEWRDAVDNEDAQVDALHREWVHLVLEELLEFEPSVLKSGDNRPTSLNYREPLTGAEVKPDFVVLSGDKPRLVISCCAQDVDLTGPLVGETWPASPIERMTMLCRATGVRVGLVTNGESWSVVSVPADGSSSVGTWFSRYWQQEPITLQAFVSLLEVRRCFGPPDGTLDTLFARSLEHQNEVTDTLGEQVRRAVEVLVQALDRADLDRDRQLLKDVSPTQLYEAGLTVMMRLVVLLCAEERKLLLLGEPIYDQHYAVSTLRSRLREEKEHLGDEVLERRHDAWARLLAVFRAVFGGIEHETLRLPALGGSLFDPDRFPFLEGRATGTSWRETPAVPLPIDNRTVLMLLTALQVLEQRTGALLLSYEALDVEQIGHVYEGLLERTVKRVPENTLGLIGSQKAFNPNIPLRELEETKSKGDGKLLAFLLERTGRSESGLKNALKKQADDAFFHRILLSCGGDIPLANRIRPFGLLLRTDSWGDPLVYRENAFAVALGAGRRETGTHYTPKSLTEPIVQHTLEPLVYIGPAEGNPREQWRLKTPAEILALKVCDMAMGSAAFLVQTCRWLGDRLVEAWDAAEKAGRAVAIEGEVLEQAGDAEILPRDKAERVLIARRLIASRCLYGVDINPMAVELAKVSLWLVTMMKGRPFSFLDHALKCGDSLLGVSDMKQIEKFSIRPGERQVTFATANLFRYVEEADKKRRELEALPSNDYTQIEAKSRLNAEAQAAIAKVKALADCLIAFELRGLSGEAYEDQRAIAADHAEAAMRKALPEFQADACEQLRGRRPFHWPVEFPEVFTCGGFDAFVGNPPFMGGQKITGALGTDYRDYLVRHLANGQRGSADLCAYFFLRAHALLRPDGGLFGLLATNTIAQGDTREVGLEQILMEVESRLIRAVPSAPWPGAAALAVSHVWLRRGNWAALCMLDGVPTGAITAMLGKATLVSGKPKILANNYGRAFQGTTVLGLGFTLTHDEANKLITHDPRNKTVIQPYLNGDDLNTSPDHAASRLIINFRDWPLDSSQDAKGKRRGPPYAADFPECLQIVEERVKPERALNNDRRRREIWWQFTRPAFDLYQAVEKTGHALVCCRHTKYVSHAFVDPKQVFDVALNVIAFRTGLGLEALHSSLFDAWVREYGSSLETRIRYTVSDCFDTFPFPVGTPSLEKAGKAYCDYRCQLMKSRQQGLTKTYNRFHDPEDIAEDITRLRTLHVDLDRVVVIAYGWSDLDLNHGFHETKQGVRYTISESARRTVLDRLLQLNHQCFAEEEKLGSHNKKKGKRQTPRGEISSSGRLQTDLPGINRSLGQGSI